MSQIEEKFDTIDEKLAELKTTVIVPEYGDLLSRFAWTREWFSSIEEVLLALAFRGESDKPILDFIRAKITDTDVLSFNDMLTHQFGVAPIKNHYQIVLDCKRTKYQSSGDILLLSNKNVPIVDYVLKNSKHSLRSMAHHFSNCQSDIAVNYLKNNPAEIHWVHFVTNQNMNAIEFCIENKYRPMYAWAGFNNDYTAKKVIEYLHQDKRLIIDSLISENPNDIIVDYLLTVPDKIEYYGFSVNPNDKAVEYLLANPDKINYEFFSTNTNEKAVMHLLARPDKIDYNAFSINSNNKAVDFMLANQDKIDYNIMLRNPNDKAMEFILNHQNPKFSDIDAFIFSLSRNTCNYNMQKYREFDKLQFFPRIPHLKML